MQGKIIKGIAGFYYVYVEGEGVYECKAKGVFRKDKKKPLVGDDVEIQILPEEEKKGNIVRLLPRKNSLVRPAVANVDQAMVVFAVADPRPNFMLLDRFLVMMEREGIPSVICFNKKDLAKEKELETLCEVYKECGYPVIPASIRDGEGAEEIMGILKGKTTVIAGPSGVGKSSLTNQMQDKIFMETGDISKKLGRGRHTTRHSQIIPVCRDTFLVDTPGFTSLYLENMEKEELKKYFAEFRQYEERCKFQGCAHIHEPECGVKEALKEKKISEVRYKNYIDLYEELKEKRRY
ncbi:ribosome small subunit-dependent GTPase A [Blautia sp. An249]|uniref:ribosome small subunit-dependent GTPase A n=1 Tax=Blautia sp. An249 TaxID=1965603 RepID=UPI000B3A2AB8|nr:ribosome small subunit-dependent GTPase A [Blautia sp. An249]OUO80654.1 ribosome small subunit-dependent GTPase A [Blautia sp. An249]